MKNNTIITSKYEGWIASLLLHGLLSIMFLFVIYDNKVEISEYANLTFSDYSPIDLPAVKEKDVLPSKNQTKPSPVVVSKPKIKTSPVVTSRPRTSQPVSTSATPTRNVDLPTRRMSERDLNQIPVESQGQLTKSGQIGTIDTKRETAIHGIDENLSSFDDQTFNSIDQGSKISSKSVGEKTDAVVVAGKKGGNVKFDKPYEISWEGVVREILYDPMPEYPPGLDKEARIRIKITVLPNGTIGDLIPLQKADATLESVTMKTLKMWRLSTLKPTDPQLNQTAVITFRFVLE